MTRLYRKNELTFSLLWIAAYVVLFSLADSLSADLGTVKLLTAPLAIGMACLLAFWICKNGLGGKYGLQKIQTGCKQYLCFLPLILISSVNLWGDLAISRSGLETALYAVSMLCVGFIEEVLFRGFLFKALCKENVRQAVLISSLTFGIGHIVNLLGGAPLPATLIQIGSAAALGLLFTLIFHYSGSLLPCIAAHSAINTLSTFAAENSLRHTLIVSIVITAVSLLYALWIYRQHAKPAR